MDLFNTSSFQVSTNQSHSSISSSNQSDFSSVFTAHILPPLYFATCIIGLSLNSVAAFIFFRVPSDSALIVYLKNIMVADLFMLSTFPFKLGAQLGLGGWKIHAVMCRYVGPLFYSSMYVGILFIGFISFERYVKIVGVLNTSQNSSTSNSSSCRSRLAVFFHLLHSIRFAQILSLITWCLLILCVLPNALLTSIPANEINARHCMQLKTALGRKWHHVSSLFSVSLFWLTLIVVAFCYTSIACHVYKSYKRVSSNNNNNNCSHACRKSNRSIFSILLVFCVCFVPYHVCRVPYSFSQMPANDFSRESRFWLFQLKEGTLFLAALNVCLDPVVYFLMCKTFRKSLIRKLSGRQRRQSLTTTQSLSNTAGHKETSTL